MGIPVEKWGRDHWSLLAYVESVCVDRQTLDHRRMRCNQNTHPLLYRMPPGLYPKGPFKYGTRLRGYFEDNAKQLADHDDWDCLDDLEAEGLVEIISMINGIVTMTDKGLKLSHTLREHKAKGGNFAGFSMDKVGATEQ